MWQEEWHEGREKELPQQFVDKRTKRDEGAQEGAAAWEPAPRVTEADRRNDRQSPLRRLDRRLYLVVKGSGGWQFPQTAHQQGETIRQTAERAMAEGIQEGPQLYFVGNCPMGHVLQPQSNTPLFLLKAQLVQGQATLKKDKGLQEHAWVLREEMPQYF
eukprot:jgi/Astpho2/2970/gw1.00051.289.1_t